MNELDPKEAQELLDMLGTDPRYKLLHNLQFATDSKWVDVSHRQYPTPDGNIAESLDIRIQTRGNLNVLSDIHIHL